MKHSLIVKMKSPWRRLAQHPMAFSKSRVVWTGAMLALVLAEPALEHAGWASSGSPGASAAGAHLAVAQLDPLAAFGLRSPGARGSGATLQTKHRLTSLPKAAPPHERVLSNIRYAPPGLIPPVLPDIMPNILQPLYPTPPPVFPPPGPPGFPIGPGGPVPPPPGMAVPPPGTPVPPVVPTPPVVTAVPEPSTWAMVMIGMFLLGAGMRSAQRRVGEARRQLPAAGNSAAASTAMD